jgi:hypothetical protein
MIEEPQTTRYQITASMTPLELLSEGYGEYDDLYDPYGEELKKVFEELDRLAEEGLLTEEESIEF